MRSAMNDARNDWWFAATAIPLIAGTMGPLTNLMAITALVMPWRDFVPGTNADVSGLPLRNDLSNPTWCIALSATSLACGVIGSISLLFKLAGAVCYGSSLALVLLCWLLAAGNLIGSIVAMHIYYRPIQGYEIYSQTYWSAVIAAVLYVLLSSTVGVNILGCRLGHYPRSGAITANQRVLVLQTLIFDLWLAIGGVAFSQSIGLSYPDALYFSTVTMLTIGFGDITTTNPLGRGLIFPYTVISTIVLGLVVSGFYQNAKDLHYHEVVRKHADQERQPAVACLGQLADYTRRYPRPPYIGTAASASGPEPNMASGSEDERRFHAMRALQKETIIFRRATSLTIIIMLFVTIWMIGAIVFWILEDNLTYFDCLYFGFCCLLTIGYGDITPSSNAGRQFFIIWSIVSVPIMTTLITKSSEIVLRIYANTARVVANWIPSARSHQSASFTRPTLSFHQTWIGKSKVQSDMAQKEEIHLSRWGLSLNEYDYVTEHSGSTLARRLAFAIQKTTKDALAGKSKQYSYKEWMEFKFLICSTELGNKNTTSFDQASHVDPKWDWAGGLSPLLSEKAEPQWVLDQLCDTLVSYGASHH
ncbi:hypothetical protein BJX99DRAFT_246164 [Aspergillus californicus]